MTFFQSVILGVIEGLTEFLPISSTGHLYLSRHLMGIEDTDFTKAFDIIIQCGAMFAVIWHCRRDFAEMIFGVFRRDRTQFKRAWHLFLAFLPAAILGLLGGSRIKRYLFAPGPIIAALIVGGVAMLWIEKSNRNKKANPDLNEKNLGAKECFSIGLFQCLALWPGTSRAMATILGGRFLGLAPGAAAQFSFLLAVPTLLAASGHDLLKEREALLSGGDNLMLILTGILVSWIIAHLVIRAFLGYLAKRDLSAFGYYRIIAGVIFWWFLV